MARKRFIGVAAAVAQVSRFTVTANDAATTYTVTVGDWSYSTVGLTDATATAAAIAAAITAATHAHAVALSAENTAGQVDVTGKDDGLPFTLAAAAASGTGTVGSVTTPTAAVSPYHWSAAENWSDGAVPVSTDDVDLVELSTPILWDIDQNAVELGTLRQYMSMTGLIGLDPYQFTGNADGTGVVATAREYRNQRLRIGYDRAELGIGDGNGPPRVALECTQAGATVTRVIRTASSSWRSPLLTVDLKLDDASAALQVDSGLVGVCANIPGETGECTVAIAASSSATRVHTGGGVTVGSWKQRHGANVLRSAATVASVLAYDGELTTEGDFTITAMTITEASVIANHRKTSGNAFTAATLEGGVLDGARSRDARTWNALTVHPGAELRFNDAITLSNLAFAAGPVALVASSP